MYSRKISAIFLTIFIIALLSSCKFSKDLDNGKYEGSLSLLFFGNPSGDGTYETKQNLKYDGNFSENKFDGKITGKTGEKTDFEYKGVVNGDVFNSSELKYTGKFTENKENTIDFKTYTIKLEKGKIKSFSFEGKYNYYGVEFEGKIDYDSDKNSIMVDGKADSPILEFIGKLKLNDIEIDDKISDKHFLIADILYNNEFFQTSNFSFEGNANFKVTTVSMTDCTYSVTKEDNNCNYIDFKGNMKNTEKKEYFDGTIKYSRINKTITYDGKWDNEYGKFLDGSITYNGFEIPEEIASQHNYINMIDNYIYLEDCGYIVDGKLYSFGKIIIDGYCDHKSSEEFSLDGKMYQFITKDYDETKIFLDGVFKLESNFVKGTGKIYFDGKLFDTGVINIEVVNEKL